MDFFGSYKSPFGYENGINGGVDSYGVDHSGFSTQDELQYQTARTIREQQMANDMVKQGIAVENYPQYGTNFWGDSANNYGFGNSNIGQNIQDVTNQLNKEVIENTNIPQFKMPNDAQQQIMESNNLQKYNNSFANFLSNSYDNLVNTYSNIKDEYFVPRDYQNRYKKGCNLSNIAYNTISNYQISPNTKLVENGNIASNYGMRKLLSYIPYIGTYINGIAGGQNIVNGLTNIYNAVDDADCFK